MTTEKNESATPQSGPSGWPGGWYVYENGKVEGPYSAEQAFRMEADATDGKPRLVSRKGFSQWYALKDLSEIFRMTEQLGHKVSEHGKISEAHLMAQAAALRAPAASPQSASTGGTPKVKAKQVEVGKTKNAGKVVASSAPMPTPTLAKKSAAPVKPVEDDDAPVPTKSKAPASTKDPQALLMQEYFLARGRLRLGKLRNPWLSGLIGLPLSFGVYWMLWIRDLTREAAFHARAPEKTGMPPLALALVPFVHMFVVYKLAGLVAEMETQNKYRSVKPAVAAALAILPPLAVIYLQAAANRHWLLHAKHSSIRKRPDTSAA